MEWPLPLWQVLGEELDQLRTPEPLDPAAYEYQPDRIINAALLKDKLELRRPELKLLLAKRPAASQNSDFAKYFASNESSQHSAGALPDVDFLNGLLRVAELYTAFPSLAESGWIGDQNPGKLATNKIIELNRHLLDRAFAGAVQPIDEILLLPAVERLHREKLSALCFSGGGIRSATFCLGVVEGLARKKLLDKFDYLSTVSGGGYLGGWLAAWTYWNKGGLRDVISQLTTARRSKLEPEPDPVFYLRNFSNYLTPRTGLFSADTWTLIGIFLRNLLLHWSVILPPLIAILLVPYLMFALMRHPWSEIALFGRTLDPWLLCFVLAVISMTVAVSYEGMARPSRATLIGERSRWWLSRRGQTSFLRYFFAPLVLSSFLFAMFLFHTQASVVRAFIAYGAVAGLLGWLVCAILLRQLFLANLLAVVLSGVAGGALLYVIVSVPLHDALQKKPVLYFCLVPPIVLIVFLLAATIFIGLVTLFTSDEDREYWARMGAWTLIAILGWSAFGAISLFGPGLLLNWTISWSLAGAASSGITTYLGWSSRTAARPESRAGTSSSSLLQRGLPLLGAIAIVLILGALALAGMWIVQMLSNGYVALKPAPESSLLGPIVSHWTAISVPKLDDNFLGGAFSGFMVLAAIVVMVIVGFVMSRFIDVNKYSLHAMYRNRLIRAYLGASREKGERSPNPFTGFDPDDNIAMWSLWRKQPRKLMPVINIALNLVAPIATKLAWQERKAESFTVTPLHVGNSRGYRCTAEYASQNILSFMKPRRADGPFALTLGTATAISGAAVSPNMGYNSSPIVAMLLSLFNVRLGWWLGNPGPAGNDTYMRSQPGSGVKYFADEAFGRTSDERPYVHLSDGGHFENLGLYEMVLRRCHTILVIDADQDARYSFENLGNAIRKIRIDMGISIDFVDFPNFAKWDEGDRKTAYCAVGQIKYDPEDAGAPEGRLIYVKPTIRGDEPADVLNYERRCGDFPHESTADQWFSETQFESYRALGMHEIEKIIGGPTGGEPKSDQSADARVILDKLR